MSPRRRDYDESDVRIRPGRRGSRPRTKERPSHEDAVTGLVTAVDRGRYTVLVDGTVVTAMKARELGRTSVVVGDRAALVGDTSGEPGTLARIVRTEPRSSVLRRTADDTDPVERVIVANADQLVVVTAVADPEPRPRLIDRCLVAAYDAGMDPLLVITKADLVDPAEFLERYAPLEVPHVVTAMVPAARVTGGGATKDDPATSPGRALSGLEAVHDHLRGRLSVLVGHSGVGKSTLVNALVPEARRATGAVNDVTGRGRHTSTSAVALRLPSAGAARGNSGDVAGAARGNSGDVAGAARGNSGDGGWVVDTPGVRSFGLAHVDPGRIIHHFPDLEPGTAGCPRGCTHDEPECALDAWVAEGHAGPAGPSRLESLRRLLESRTPQAGD
ncbi:MAG TPA: ribosome small subunit-dependent GTPase A [Segeticoccus sp.]|uniref:ribosome small subunit-dependent GTPase A n=1 Tax=Segeticoccus sp. TaxID=2706531 RepID=UPI002D7FC41F|nr:ribosome small subunit-dependent GTPase A [Segeticoccus sp.]HET8602211.1 ribosome small subunit-dependent GTPase A [Segeticoccus sp.]